MERKKIQEANLCDRFDRLEIQLNLNSEVKNTRLEVQVLKEELHALNKFMADQLINRNKLDEELNKNYKTEKEEMDLAIKNYKKTY